MNQGRRKSVTTLLIPAIMTLILFPAVGLARDEDDSTQPRTDFEQLIESARHALFDLRASTAVNGVWTTTRGILLTESGFGVSVFHPLKDARAATADLPGHDKPLPVELWNADPMLNLALVKLDLRALPDGTRLRPLDMASVTDLNRSAAWVLGTDRFGRATVTAGKITDILPYTDLDADVRKAMRYDNMSWWIVASCPVDINSSGGVMLDGNGKLAGLSTWYWGGSPAVAEQEAARAPRGPRDWRRRREEARRAENDQAAGKYYALYVEHIRDLLETRPDEPMTFAAARQQFFATRMPASTLPRLAVDSPLHAQQLRRAANSFVQASICPMCQGAGQIVVEKGESSPAYIKVPGSARMVPNVQANTDSDDQPQYRDCTRCQGTGLNKSQTIFRIGANVAMCLAATDRNDRRSQAELVHLQNCLAQIIQRNPQRLVDTINSEARLHLHPTAMTVGTPILAIGVAESLSDSMGEFGQLTRVTLGEPGPTILVAEPDLADPKTPDIVLVGGILSGYIDDEHGLPMPVVHRGFLVNLPNEAEADSQAQKLQEQMQTRQQQIARRMQRWQQWMQQRYLRDRDSRRRR
jgi:hypothetical protein